VAPPGLDPRIVQALRKAFTEAMHDPQFMTEGQKIDMELNFVAGEEVQALIERLYKSPSDAVSRAQAIATAN
jgi:tripartite-type tricarboxylate transporter receptor subunit TctC